ncbi:MAG: 1-deoxy-D-xylulose-5-phosphate reductoisomerase [Desulfotomaculaceae bacterium]|nr:1-deoxy-D-xylulose-5-phosphate reductoisomerase [Desulfotomaculaceae bacterium]
MKKVVILGSTGSIGTQTLDVIRNLAGEFEVVGLGAGDNWRLLADQIKEFLPRAAALANQEGLSLLRKELPAQVRLELDWGREGMKSLAGMPEADLVIIAVAGAAGIYPTFTALNAGKDVALANKETLVTAGQLVMDLAARKNKSVLPVDSEHSAVWQCLNGHCLEELEKIILTASGGPFRSKSREELEKVTVAMALKHPNWSMGSKITIDSATLMNKGLEVIEAKWLFGVGYGQIEVVVHPQSIIHSAVEFKDGSVIAQMGLPDMRLPIQYALTFPRRVLGPVPRLDWTKLQKLTFEAPDTAKFPSLRLAYEAGMTGGTMPAVLNGANETAVHAFLQGRIPFLSIPIVVEKVMEKHTSINNPDLGEIMEADIWSRAIAGEFLRF